MKNNLKLLLPMLALVCTSWTAQAQTDLKVSPFSIIFGRMILRGEFAASENFGVELLGGGAWNSYNFDDEGDVKFNNYHLGANGRYYFNPSQGIDKFYIGGYLKYAGGKGTNSETDGEVNTTRFALGTLVGFKTVSRNGHLLFDFNVGFGRALVYKIEGDNPEDDIDLSDFPFLNWDIPVLVGIGYRF
ncbi:MAG: hypothetical protein IPI11_06485 [Haliscomenobacter sp.]|nr:hypothetical protein [Haliscomenobacter sp.]